LFFGLRGTYLRNVVARDAYFDRIVDPSWIGDHEPNFNPSPR
jgi:hypothetical protein